MEKMLTQEGNSYYQDSNVKINKDFTTSPEISQVFGEVIATNIFAKMIQNPQKQYALFEFGPGNGTLMDDVIRTLDNYFRKFSMFIDVKFFGFDVSKPLIKLQKARWQKYQTKYQIYHISTLQEYSNILVEKKFYPIIIMNEFLDALPIDICKIVDEQYYIQTLTTEYKKDFQLNWLKLDESHKIFKYIERYLKPTLAKITDRPKEIICDLPTGKIEFITQFLDIISRHGAYGIIIDYGYIYPYIDSDNSTLQAIKNKKILPLWKSCDIQDYIGADFTAHINFGLLKNLFQKYHANTSVTSQRDFLLTNGIEQRTEKLIQDNPSNKESILSGKERLIDVEYSTSMGNLFKCLTFDLDISINVK